VGESTLGERTIAWLWVAGNRVLLLLLSMMARNALAASDTGNVRVQGQRSQLVFACDSDTPRLQSLFADPTLIPELKDLRAEIALSLTDLSPERAQLVRRLNGAGIATIAWMALPASEGYYLNANSAPAAEKRFAELEKWTAENDLHWAAVGLDIEPSLEDWAQIQQGHRWRMVRTFLSRAFDGEKVARARAAYQKLIRKMQEHGYAVETYQLLFVADARRVHSTLLERLFGIVDVRGNDEALMVYSSFNHALDGALLWSYGPDAQSIAVGSTASTGNPQTDAKFGPLNWEEFSTDLIVASHFSKLVGVYNLEGCIRQGFLPKLQSLNWETSVTLSTTTVAKARKFRRGVQTALWVASHLVYIGIILLLLIAWFGVWLKRRLRPRSADVPHVGIVR
jgi:hypothetical protein